MTILGIAAGIGAVIALMGVWFFAGAPIPEPTIRYSADGATAQNEFLENGQFTVRVPGKTIQIEGELESASCIRGKNLRG